MRSGFHPLKKIGSLDPPANITVQMVTFIPFLSGYFEHSLEILRLSLESLWKNTERPYDLMIFDNCSCPEVRAYLLERLDSGYIQQLILADRNVGLPGAWNALFNAALGEIVAYADSDIYFYPGWLPAHLEVLRVYPRVGMVTGIPLRSPLKYSSKTLEWAEATPEVVLKRGQLQGWDIYRSHTRSLGMSEAEARQKFDESEDFYFEYQGVPAYLGAGHFQFVSPRAVLREVMPFPYIMPMGNERYLDEKINDRGYLRLSLPSMFVQHLGNRLSPEDLPGNLSVPLKKPGKRAENSIIYRLSDLPLVKKVLLYVHTRIFRLYYDRGK